VSIADSFKKKPNPTEEIPQPDLALSLGCFPELIDPEFKK